VDPFPATGGRLFARRVTLIVLLTLAAIAAHEFGHYLIYTIAGYPVLITLQSVHAAGPVDARLDGWAKLAGPVLSLGLASLCLLISRRRRTFGWATASFTNASLRLFPLAMDLTRALKRGPPFSDEGDVTVALAGADSAMRPWLLAIPIALSLLLTIMAAREYHFRGRTALKAVGVYLLSLAVGIAVVIVDELMHQR